MEFVSCVRALEVYDRASKNLQLESKRKMKGRSLKTSSKYTKEKKLRRILKDRNKREIKNSPC